METGKNNKIAIKYLNAGVLKNVFHEETTVCLTFLYNQLFM